MEPSDKNIANEAHQHYFKHIFDTYYPAVKRKAMALVRNEAVAEDLAQEAFLRLYRNPPERQESIGAWLHRVATRLGYDYLNKMVRERTSIEKREQLYQPDRPPSNEDVMMKRLEQEEVREWLGELPERDRQVLMLRYSGYSYNEIADEMNVRPPLVGTLLSRATARLKRQAEASYAQNPAE